MGLEQQDLLATMRWIIKFLLAITLMGVAGFTIYMVQQGLDPLNINDVKKAVFGRVHQGFDGAPLDIQVGQHTGGLVEHVLEEAV